MNIGIIYNCAQEDLFKVYRSKIVWAGLLQQWMKSSDEVIKLHCIFLLGFLAPYLPESDLSKLISCFTRKDMKFVVDLLKSSASTTSLTAKCHGTLFSADELLLNILNLVELSPGNYDTVANSELLHSCSSLLQNGSESIQLLTCRLLWRMCMDSQLSKTDLAESCFQKEVDGLCQSTDPNVELVAKCIQATLNKDSISTGMCISAWLGRG